MANKNYTLGNVKLTKWFNEKDMVSYTMEKSYKDDKDEWETTKSFGDRELLKLKVLIDRALNEDIREFENK